MKNKNHALVLFAVITAVITLSGCTNNQAKESETVSTTESTNITTTTKAETTTYTEITTTHSIITTSSYSPTMGEKNALNTAYNYLEYTAFSYNGLIEQLEFEGYTHSEAVYGADNCGADWNEQAEKMAKQYLDYSSFSKQGLIDQLEFEGFTHSQAVHGVEANGY